jgi:hypothetical protein
LFWPIYQVKEAKFLAAIFEAASQRVNPDATVTHAQLGPTGTLRLFDVVIPQLDGMERQATGQTDQDG